MMFDASEGRLRGVNGDRHDYRHLRPEGAITRACLLTDLDCSFRTEAG